MIQPIHIRNIAWGLTVLFEVILLVELFRRKTFRSYPLFTAYVLSTITQAGIGAFLYAGNEWQPATIWDIAWGTQLCVIGMRSLSLVELAKKMLSPYGGLWALCRRLAVVLVTAVLVYAWIVSNGSYQWSIINTVRGMELALAAAIVTMLLFARYYRLAVDSLSRALAVGFCLYSAFYVIDFSILERGLGLGFKPHEDFWNFLGMLTFLASLVVWIRATNRYAAVPVASRPVLISQELHGKLTSEVNLRLYLLNRQLSRLMHMEDQRP